MACERVNSADSLIEMYIESEKKKNIEKIDSSYFLNSGNSSVSSDEIVMLVVNSRDGIGKYS